MTNCIDTILFGQVCDSCDGGAIFKIIAYIIQFLTYGVAALGVLGLVIAGIVYMTSNGDPSRMTKALSRIKQVVIGLLSYGLLFAFLEFLIPGGIVGTTLDSETSSCPVHTVATPTNDEDASRTAQSTSNSSGQSSSQGDPVAQVAMGDRIARTAALFAEPLQDWQIDSPDYSSRQIGAYTNSPRAAYEDAARSNGITKKLCSCDTFLITVLYSLGIADGLNKSAGAQTITKHLERSSNWTEIPNEGLSMLDENSSNRLLPGDVFASGICDSSGCRGGHVSIYVGEYGGIYGSNAAGSGNDSYACGSNDKYGRITNYISSSNGSYSSTICNGKFANTVTGQNRCENYTIFRIFRYTGSSS